MNKLQKDEKTFAGIHLLIDFYHASNLTDEHLIEEALENAASAVNAKKIDIFGYGNLKIIKFAY